MNDAPLFALAVATPAVLAVLGANPTRLYPFGDSPQKGEPLYGRPYAVWQTVYGSPENYLNQRPDVDNWGVQVDVYADTVANARSIRDALLVAWEDDGHVTAWNGDGRETNTKLYRISFTVEFWTPR